MLLLLVPLSLLCIEAKVSGGLLSCPRNYVMSHEQLLGCAVLVKDEKGNPVQVTFSSLTLSAGSGQIISSPSVAFSDSFSFAVTAGNVSDKFELTTSVSGILPLDIYVLAFPDDSDLTCDSEAIGLHESTECHIIPKVNNQTVYAPNNIFKTNADVKFGSALGLKIAPVLPLFFEKTFHFNITAGSTSAKLFITDGKTRRPFLLSIFSAPDATTSIICEGRNNATWSIIAGATVACIVRPKVNRTPVVALASAFALSSTAASAVFGSLSGEPSSVFSDEFKFYFLPGRVTGQFSLSVGIGSPLPFFIYALPDFSTSFTCEDNNVAVSAFVRCFIYPSQNEAAVYALASSFTVSVLSSVGGLVGEVLPADKPSQKLEFLFYATNATVGDVTLSVSGVTSSVVISIVKAGRPRNSQLSCENSTMLVLSENYCTITTVDEKGKVWSTSEFFVLSSTIGGSFSGVAPNIGKQFSFIYMSGAEAGKGFLSDSIGNPYEITVLGDSDEKLFHQFIYFSLICLGSLLFCLSCGRFYRCIRHKRHLKSSRGQPIESSLLASIEHDNFE